MMIPCFVAGDLGPVYGFQWRHFGAEYRGMDVDYKNEGVDQLADVVRRIKENPSDRRIIMCAWNAKGKLLKISSVEFPVFTSPVLIICILPVVK